MNVFALLSSMHILNSLGTLCNIRLFPLPNHPCICQSPTNRGRAKSKTPEGFFTYLHWFPLCVCLWCSLFSTGLRRYSLVFTKLHVCPGIVCPCQLGYWSAGGGAFFITLCLLVFDFFAPPHIPGPRVKLRNGAGVCKKAPLRNIRQCGKVGFRSTELGSGECFLPLDRRANARRKACFVHRHQDDKASCSISAPGNCVPVCLDRCHNVYLAFLLLQVNRVWTTLTLSQKGSMNNYL